MLDLYVVKENRKFFHLFPCVELIISNVKQNSVVNFAILKLWGWGIDYNVKIKMKKVLSFFPSVK